MSNFIAQSPTLSPSLLLTFTSKEIHGNYNARQLTLTTIYKALDFYSRQLTYLSGFGYRLSIEQLCQSLSSLSKLDRAKTKSNLDHLAKRIANRPDKLQLQKFLQTLLILL
jgi:hypothetical protein